jgi:hypothetical protein
MAIVFGGRHERVRQLGRGVYVDVGMEGAQEVGHCKLGDCTWSDEKLSM